jgi:hypothetical protein
LQLAAAVAHAEASTFTLRVSGEERLVHAERAVGIATAQHRVGLVVAVQGVFARESRGTGAEVCVERFGGLFPRALLRVVVAERDLRVVTACVCCDDFFEERNALGRLVCIDQGDAERGIHADVIRRQLVRTIEERDSRVVLALDAEDRRAQDVDVETTRCHGECFVEHVAGAFVVLRGESALALFDEELALFVLIAALGERDDRRDGRGG